MFGVTALSYPTPGIVTLDSGLPQPTTARTQIVGKFK
jgi:hypothetical protein